MRRGSCGLHAAALCVPLGPAEGGGVCVLQHRLTSHTHTPLLSAARRGEECRCCSCLLKTLTVGADLLDLRHLGVNIDCRDQWGQTPLHVAALAGHAEVVELLLKKNCNIDAGADTPSSSISYFNRWRFAKTRSGRSWTQKELNKRAFFAQQRMTRVKRRSMWHATRPLSTL